MRLLVVVNVYRPDLGGGVLFADLCEGLASRGFEVEVRCAVPYYPEWRDKEGMNGLPIHETRQSGVRVRRHGLFIPNRPSSLAQRLAYEASFFASLMRDLPEPGRFDAVMAYCPLVGGVAYGALAARSAGCPLWLNVQDLSAEAAEAAGIVRFGAAAQLFRRIQRFLFNRAGVWSTISPVMRERLIPLTRGRQPVHLLPNWLHGSLAREIEGRAPIATNAPSSRAPGAEDAPARPWRLLYSGNIGGKQDLLRFCHELARSDADFRFDIRGGGADASEVRDWVSSSGDPRFSFSALTDEAGLASALQAADFFVVTEKSGAGGSFIPSKLLPAFGAGTPVLGVSDPDSPLGRELREAQAGPILTWDSVGRVAEILSRNSPNSPVVRAWRNAASARSAHYDRDHIIDQYAHLLRAMIQSA